MRILLIFLLSFLSFSQFSAKGEDRKQKISDINVLLPICKSKPCGTVSYRVSAYGGCYDWTLDNSDFLDLKKIQDEDNENCYTSVVISTRSDQDPNKQVFLTARDKKSNEEFKCKVGFAYLNRLLIAKRFDHMNVGEVVELNLIAYDNFNNVFSSLEGFKFNWKVDNTASAQLIRLKEERKEASYTRLNIEDEAYSDIVLLRGILTGRLNIEVEIKENGYQIKTDAPMKLYVVEPFRIEPDEVYVLTRSTFPFKIVFENNFSRILPINSNYKWSLEKQDCGSLDSNGVLSSSRDQCHCDLIAEDKRIDLFNKAKSRVHIVEPTALELGIKEIEDISIDKFSSYDFSSSQFNYISHWELVVDKFYVVKNFLFFETHPINDLSKIKYNFQENNFLNYFQKVKCDNENKYCIVKTIKVSEKEFDITSSIARDQIVKILSVKKYVTIYPKVEITKFRKQKFILPYLGYIVNDSRLLSQELRLIVKGGSGKYKYISEDENVIMIQNDIIYGQSIGTTVVKVIDSRVSSNYDSMVIEVKEVVSLDFMEERQEIELGKDFSVSTIGLERESNQFTNCTNLEVFPSSYKEIETNDFKTNYFKIQDFIAANPDLLELKFQEEPNKEYLKYSSFGICSNHLFRGDTEGLLKLKFYSKNYKFKSDNEEQSSSLKYAQIHVFGKMEIISPRFEDAFTKQLLARLGKNQDDIYVIPKDTFINIKIKGGISQWVDYRDDYNEQIFYRNLNDLETESRVIQKYETKKEKNLVFKCKENNDKDNEIKVVSKNKQSRTLLRPKVSSLHFKISCNKPTSLAIYVMDPNTISNRELDENPFKDHELEQRLNDIYSVEQRNRIEYFIRKASKERVRVYAYDSHKRMFFNLTQIPGIWEINYHKVNLTEDKINEMNYKRDILKNTAQRPEFPEFVHRKIKFSDFNAKFSLFYKIKELDQEIIIYLIDFPIIKPEITSLFLNEHHSATLDILYGSGDFEVQYVNEDLAKADYFKNDRQIIVYPKRQGVFQVKVRDRKITHRIEAKATVYISGINSIKLIGGGLLQENSTRTLKMQVFDNHGNIFTDDNLKMMKLQFEVRSGNKDNGIEFILKDGLILSNFQVKGIIPDIYDIRVIDTVSKIQSNLVKINVFPKIEVFPPYILMLPKYRYWVDITGGPVDTTNIVRSFTVLDTEIATVKENEPEILANKIGKTVMKVRIELRQSEYNEYDLPAEIILCNEEVILEVALADGVEIYNAPNRKIFNKSTIRLIAFLKLGQRTFAFADYNIDYHWIVDPPTNAYLTNTGLIMKPDCADYKTETCTRKEIPIHNSIGVFLTALNKGISEIKLKIKINYAEGVYYKQNVFERIEKLIIDDNLFIEISEFYNYDPNKSGLYLVPVNVGHELRTNKDQSFTKFSLIQSKDHEAVFTLSSSGRIQTNSRVGYSSVLVEKKDKENGPFTPIILPVYVSKFYSVFIEKSYTLLDMEIGQRYNLRIIIQHEFGLLFAERFDSLPLRVIESNPLVAKAEIRDENSRLSISAQTRGECHIVLYNTVTKQIYDVIKVSVFTSFQLPKKINLNVGSQINFLGKDIKKKNYLLNDAEWKIEDPSILKIDSITRNFKAISEGTTRVHLMSHDRTKTILSTTIKIGRIKKINIESTQLPAFVTSIKSHTGYLSEYRIPFKYYLDDGIEELSYNYNDDVNVIDQNLNLKCVSLQPEIFSISIADRLINGVVQAEEKECVIKLRDLPPKIRDIPKNIEFEITTESQGERPQDRYTFKTKFVIPYAESFRIIGDSKEITLSKKKRSINLEITNFNDLEIINDNPKLIRTTKDGNKLKITIPNDVNESFEEKKIIISNKLSTQREEIIVNFDMTRAEEEKHAKIFGIKKNSLIDFVSLLILLITIIFIVKYLLRSDNNNNSHFLTNNGRSMNYASSAPRGSSAKSMHFTHN